MSNPAVFNYAAWVATFPEFSAVSQNTATNYFAIAMAVQPGLNNVSDEQGLQTAYINMLVAHVAALFSNADGTPSASNTLVGRLSSVSEGSVSAQAEYAAQVGQSMAWYVQTKYGALYWQATANFRSATYRPGIRRGLTLAQVPWLYPQGLN